MRLSFRHDLIFELAARGLDFRRAAALAGLSEVTVSAAAHGRQVNLATAMRLAKLLEGHAVIPELARCLAGQDPGASHSLERGAT